MDERERGSARAIYRGGRLRRHPVWAGGPLADFYSLQGTSWNDQRLPDAGSSQAISGLAASPSEAWAVNGDVVPLHRKLGLAFHPVDFSGNTAFPTAVSGRGPGQIAVVGTNG